MILYKINILAIYVNTPIYIYSTVTYLVNEQKKKKGADRFIWANTASGARGKGERLEIKIVFLGVYSHGSVTTKLDKHNARQRRAYVQSSWEVSVRFFLQWS